MEVQAQKGDFVVCGEVFRGKNVGRHMELQGQRGDFVLCGEVFRRKNVGRHIKVQAQHDINWCVEGCLEERMMGDI